MSIAEEYLDEISKIAEMHIKEIRYWIIMSIVMSIALSAVGIIFIIKIDPKLKASIKYLLLVLLFLCVFVPLAIIYGNTQIKGIRNDVVDKNWIEYDGDLFFDSSRGWLYLSSIGLKIPLSDRQEQGVINNNYVKIPSRNSHGYLVILKNSKRIVLFIPNYSK